MNSKDVENLVSGSRKSEKAELEMPRRILEDRKNVVKSQTTNFAKVPEQVTDGWNRKVDVQLHCMPKPEVKGSSCTPEDPKKSDPEALMDIEERCLEEITARGTVCWNLLEFELPEYPLQRNAKTIGKMIEEMDNMHKKFRLHSDIPDKNNIINLFEILYILEIASVEQIEGVCKIIESAKSNGIETKSINLYHALEYVRELTHSKVEQNHGLLEVECFILEMHRRIVLDLDPKYQGGKFSTNPRFGVVDPNTKHYYPKFESVDDARCEVQRVIDRYNVLLDEIKTSFNKDSKRATEKLFKLSGLLLFKILYYHPFGEGNGRLARLLSSYALSLINPFPTPIYGLFSPSKKEEYVDALIEARKSNDNPSTLTALIIESSYYTWTKFYEVVELAKVQGETWEELRLNCASLAKMLTAQAE